MVRFVPDKFGTGFLAGDAMNPWLCEELMDGDRAIAVSHRHRWRGLTSMRSCPVMNQALNIQGPLQAF